MFNSLLRIIQYSTSKLESVTYDSLYWSTMYFILFTHMLPLFSVESGLQAQHFAKIKLYPTELPARVQNCMILITGVWLLLSRIPVRL